MSYIAERLRDEYVSYEDCIEAADEIERLKAKHAQLLEISAVEMRKRDDEIGRLRMALRINGLRWGHTHEEIDALIADRNNKQSKDGREKAEQDNRE